MPSKQKRSMEFLYNNPFDDYNANVLDPEMILEYWFTPFNTGALKDFDEQKFFTQKMPIILQGSRGSGKTTILKYFSFPVQCERATRSRIPIKRQLARDKGVGFYFRCDDSFLKEFKSVFITSVKEQWIMCFEHYFELFFVKNILEMLEKICNESESTNNKNAQACILTNANLCELADDLCFDNIEELKNYIGSELRYINTFKNEALFSNASFSPNHVWSMYQISERLIQAISQTFPELEKINYLLLIDEFENLPTELQKMFNTQIKFCRQNVSMRVGRRSENIVTTETINSIEYLREQHDYSLIVLDQNQEIKSLQPYLFGIAEKRLSAMKDNTLPTDIISILGESEDLDAECQRVANEKNNHLKVLLKTNPRITSTEGLMDQVISIISYPENRLAEMLNALWVSKCEDGQNIIDTAHHTVAAMHAFFGKKNHPLVAKYENDYHNKYRYALTVLLCASYRKDKSYYSFNTICYLSEGNARTFINLCKSILSDAFFYEKKNLLTSKKVSIESQCRAIRNYSKNEFDSVCSIIQNGKAIREFLLNIGNIFSEYHKDPYVRYPETTQFTYSPDELSEDAREILNTAINWSLIKRKDNTQRISAEVAKKGDLYSINRIFAPIFNISYRVRGGVNVVLSPAEVEAMISGQYTKSKLSKSTSKKRSNPTKVSSESLPLGQISFFD